MTWLPLPAWLPERRARAGSIRASGSGPGANAVAPTPTQPRTRPIAHVFPWSPQNVPARILTMQLPGRPAHARPPAWSHQPVDLDRFLMALDVAMLGRRQLGQVKRGAVLDGAECAAAHQHDHLLAVLHELLAELFEALGDVHRVAHHREIDSPGCTDIAHHGRPRMQADADADGRLAGGGAHRVVLLDRSGDGKRCPDRRTGVVLVARDATPHRHHR